MKRIVLFAVMEAENMKLINITSENISFQSSDRWGWSQNVQLFRTGVKTGDEMEVIFICNKEFDAHVTARFTVAPDYGTVRLSLNEKPVPGTFNLFNQEVSTREVYLGRIRIMEGENQLKVSITSLSSMDGRAFFGLDVLRFSD